MQSISKRRRASRPHRPLVDDPDCEVDASDSRMLTQREQAMHPDLRQAINNPASFPRPPSGAPRKRLAFFIKVLYHLVNNEEEWAQCISWNSSNDGLIIHDEEKLRSFALPRYGLSRELQEAEEEKLVAVEDTLKRAAHEREQAIQAVRNQCTEEQEEAMEELREESEKLLGSIEGAMNKLREERDLTEEECTELREQLEAQEEISFRLRKQVELLKKSGVMQGLKLLFVVANMIKQKNTLQTQMQQEKERALEKQEQQWREKYEKLYAEFNNEKSKTREFVIMQNGLRETLTNHKREMLLEHKIQSSVLQNDIADIFERKHALQSKQEELVKVMGGMEGQIRQLESQMQELSRQSVIKDGEVDVGLSRKKKRVDRDLDNMLIKISEQKGKITDINKQLNEAETERQTKEEELKYVEAQLVNTLLEQQKHLMKVLRSVKVDVDDLHQQQEPIGDLYFDEVLSDKMQKVLADHQPDTSPQDTQPSKTEPGTETSDMEFADHDDTDGNSSDGYVVE